MGLFAIKSEEKNDVRSLLTYQKNSEKGVKTINRVVEIPVEEIRPNQHQPRTVFDEEELLLLSRSIQQDGIIQPLTVRRNNTYYELVSGERRLRAAKLAGMQTVPCIIINVTERTSALLALIENIQRQDLGFFEEATAISKLISFYGMTQEDAAHHLGMAQSTIANKLRLLKLSPQEQTAITDGRLTERHARAFLRLPCGELREKVIDEVIKLSLNVEKTEELISKTLEGERERESYRKRSAVFKDVRLFMHTINQAVAVMQKAGVKANAKKTEKDDVIEYVITIAKTVDKGQLTVDNG